MQLLQAVLDEIDGGSALVFLMPWMRCQELAKLGKLDGVLPSFINDARKGYLAFSEPTFIQSTSFWYNREAQGGDFIWGALVISRARVLGRRGA